MLRLLALIVVLAAPVNAWTQAQTVKATRFFHSNGGYACTNSYNQRTWNLATGIDTHPPITAPSINIVAMWLGNFAYVDVGGGALRRGDNAIVNVFRSSYQGACAADCGELMLQYERGQAQSYVQFPAPGFRLYQSDILTVTYSCDAVSGQPSVQDTAGWIWYTENP